MHGNALHYVSDCASRWVQTSQLPALLHPADPDLQPHVGVAQVRPKTVLRWGNYHIQRHPPDCAGAHTPRKTLLWVPSPNVTPTNQQKKPTKKMSTVLVAPAGPGQVFQESWLREKSCYNNRRSKISGNTLIKSANSEKKIPCSDHKNS